MKKSRKVIAFLLVLTLMLAITVVAGAAITCPKGHGVGTTLNTFLRYKQATVVSHLVYTCHNMRCACGEHWVYEEEVGRAENHTGTYSCTLCGYRAQLKGIKRLEEERL